MSPVGISRCAMHAVSRSAQSGGRHNAEYVRDGTRLYNKSQPNRCARSPDTACREEATGRHSRARLNCARVRVSPAIGSPCQ
jgi:hypothetical protein